MQFFNDFSQTLVCIGFAEVVMSMRLQWVRDLRGATSKNDSHQSRSVRLAPYTKYRDRHSGVTRRKNMFVAFATR
jgi:hypothetical protein